MVSYRSDNICYRSHNKRLLYDRRLNNVKILIFNNLHCYIDNAITITGYRLCKFYKPNSF